MYLSARRFEICSGDDNERSSIEVGARGRDTITGVDVAQRVGVDYMDSAGSGVGQDTIDQLDILAQQVEPDALDVRRMESKVRWGQKCIG